MSYFNLSLQDVNQMSYFNMSLQEVTKWAILTWLCKKLPNELF